MDNQKTKRLVVSDSTRFDTNQKAEQVVLLNFAGERISTKTDEELNSQYGPLPKSPSPRRPVPSSVITSFQSGHGWANPFGWGTLADDTTEGDFFIGTQSLSISSFSGGVSAATIESRIDTAVANHNWLVLVFHRASDSPASTLDYTYADLATIAAQLQTSGIAVKPQRIECTFDEHTGMTLVVELRKERS